VAGTFQDRHPAIKEFNQQEQYEYETRVSELAGLDGVGKEGRGYQGDKGAPSGDA
jgi:hypothetical protein